MAKILKKHSVNRSVLELARERINRAYDLFDHVAVSFSGGKDSTACLNLTLEVARERGKLPLHVFHFDEEAIPYETEAYVRRVAQLPDIKLDWYCLPVKHRNGCSRSSPWWYPWAPEDEAKWVRPLPPEALTLDDVPRYPRDPAKRLTIPDTVGLLFPPKEYGRTCMVMGIRADESITRQRAVSRRREENYLVPWEEGTSQGNLTKCYPVYDWRTEDIWTAPAKLGWDYNRAYDAMEMAGIPHLQQRCAPPYGEEPMRGLWQFAVCFPDIWDRMQHRVPGAATAARYSQTELYGFGGYPEKPADMPWEDFVLHYLGKWRPKDRAFIARRIRDEMRNHYRKTRDPILEVPHPDTGVSWNYLLNLAQRGDLKGRRQPQVYTNPEQRAAVRSRYEQALAEFRAKPKEKRSA